MGNEIDDRIVAIHFDNREFERNIAETIESLARFRESLDFSNSVHGLEELSVASSDFDLEGMGNAIENISSKFSAMGAIGFTVISQLTKTVLDFVSNIGKATVGDVFGRIISGGKARSTNIEQAKFMFRGLGIEVEQGMDSALKAVLGTAFGLDEAAKAAAQFGASGIKVGADMTSALRGVAGAAALTGRSFTEIADIFAGSAGTGRVTNQDLMQFATRGLNAAAALAKAMGTTEAKVHQMATAGTLDFATFAKNMDKAFGEHATKANETYTGSLANMRAAMSRLGATFFTPKLEQMRTIFNALTPVIDNVSKALQPLFKIILDIGQIGTNKIINLLKGLDLTNFSQSILNVAAGIESLFSGVRQFIAPIKEAFRDIFPKSTVSILLVITDGFKRLMAGLKMGVQTIDEIKSVFRGLFAIVEIGWTILKEFAIVLKEAFGSIFQFTKAGSLLRLAAGLGEMAVKLNETLVAGGAIHRFFIRLREEITKLIVFIRSLDEKFDELKNKLIEFRDKTKDIFESVSDSKQVEGSLGRIGTRMDHLSSGWQRFQERMQGFYKVLSKIGELIKDWFASLGNKIAAAFKPGDFNAAVDIVNVGLLGGIAVMLQKFLSGGFLKVGSGFLDKISGALDQLTKTLGAMQAKVKSEALLKIAFAVGILTASMVVLSLIDSAALTKALTSMAVGFGQLVGVMVLLDKNVKGAGKIAVLSAALIGISSAIVILSGAILILSKLDPGELATGLAGISTGLGLLVGATRLISTDASGLILATTAMIGMSTALVVISGVVKIFASMSLVELAKGLGAVATALAIIVGATLLMSTDPAGLLAGTAAILGLAGALVIISGVIKIFSTMSLPDLAKGLGAMAAALAILVGVTYLMSTNAAGLIAGAAAMVLMAGAVNLMAVAVLRMGQADLGTLAKGIGSIAAVLLILAVGIHAMTGAVAGAAALIVTSAAMLILANVMEKLGKLSLKEIGIALLAIAGVLAVLGVAAALLTPVIPTMLALGQALLWIGGGFALFGIGAMTVIKAIEMLATSGKKGMQALTDVLKIFAASIPEMVKAFVSGITGMASELLAAVPLLVRLIEALLLQVLETVIKLAPEVAKAISAIITQAIKLIRELFPQVVTLGLELVIMLLEGIRDNIADVIKVGAEILVAFIQGISDNIGSVVGAVVNLITTFISTLTENYLLIVAAGYKILTDLLSGIADNIIKVVECGADIIVKLLKSISDKIDDVTKAGAQFIIDLVAGIAGKIQWVIDEGIKIAIAFLNGLVDASIDFAYAAGRVLIKFLNGMAEAIRANTPGLHAAGKNIALAIADGITLGLASKTKSVVESGLNLGKKLGGGILDRAKSAVGADSPAKEFIKLGQNIIDGLAIGVENDGKAINSAENLSKRILTTFEETLSKIPDSLSGMEEFNPVITPVLDLTKVQAASGDINKFMKMSSLVPTVSIDRANVISSTANVPGTESVSTPSGPSELKFEQNIYAPKALTTNDIYRNTKSQIALAKEELGIK